MQSMNTEQIISYLTKNPGSIASEIGTTNNVMKELEQQGLVTRIGNRQTGKRGRPPVEWVAGKVTVEVKQKLEERPAPEKEKKIPSLSPVPDGLDEETRRKFAYIDRQINSGLRSDEDMGFLMNTRRDLLRRARPNNNNPLNTIKPEVEFDDSATDEELVAA